MSTVFSVDKVYRGLLSTAGNVLSALVWLRLRAVHKNTAAIYLASLAINDAVYLLIGLVMSLWRWLLPQLQQPGYVTLVTDVITASARRLEPLLVLAFSVERMITVCYPFLVRYRHTPAIVYTAYACYVAWRLLLHAVMC